MTRIIKTLLMAVVMVVSCATTFAQQPNSQHPNRQQRISREQLAEIEAKHIAQELAFKFLSQTQIEKVYEQERKIINRHAKRGQRQVNKKQRNS